MYEVIIRLNSDPLTVTSIISDDHIHTRHIEEREQNQRYDQYDSKSG
jgi:hypothetical protein